jgi:hypothetical protein
VARVIRRSTTATSGNGKERPNENTGQKLRLHVADKGNGTTFNEIDLSGIDVSVEELQTIGEMVDGRCLFYPGSVNMLFGWTAEGKSWIALYTCYQEVRKGRHVIYVDYEDHPRRIKIKMLSLGTTEDDLDTYFHYVHPAESLKSLIEEAEEKEDPVTPALERFIRLAQVSVVVIDTTGESMASEGLDENAAPQVIQWYELWGRPLAALGPAVVVLDHVTNDPMTRGRPKGSGDKLGGTDGSAYSVVMVKKQPFGKHRVGLANVTAVRDKAGNYALGDVVAVFRLDATTEVYRASLELPDPTRTQDNDNADEGWRKRSKCMKALDEWLEAKGEGAKVNVRDFSEPVSGNFRAATKREAVSWLVHLGCWGREKLGQEKLHWRIKPFQEDMMPQEDDDYDDQEDDFALRGRNGSDGQVTDIRRRIRRLK